MYTQRKALLLLVQQGDRAELYISKLLWSCRDSGHAPFELFYYLHKYLKDKTLLFTIHSVVFNHIFRGATLRKGGSCPPSDPPRISAYDLRSTFLIKTVFSACCNKSLFFCTKQAKMFSETDQQDVIEY